ncbi:MAG: DNA (cytosine-5-)-methyltransferase [Chloracidobacterium sp.]|nr:DNA (cytosine-5-)-methyltransferase [Chloracidobacterium sp.]
MSIPNDEIGIDEVRRIFELDVNEYSRAIEERTSKTKNKRSKAKNCRLKSGQTQRKESKESGILESTVDAFTFVDLFAGIGGFHIGLQEAGGRCIFASEINSHAQEAYKLNFGITPHGDITKEEVRMSVPSGIGVLSAGFPCQPFSISGKRKGFEDTRGTLIYHVFKIIEERNPEVVFLENVKHLVHHDRGRTLKTILHHLEALGFKTEFKVLNAADFGVPQNRERIIIIGNRDKRFDFSKLERKPSKVLRDILEENVHYEYLDEEYTLLSDPKVQPSGLIFAGYRNKRIRKAGVRPGTEHLSRVHKQPNRIYSADGVHPALSSQEPTGRYWILHEGEVRKLTLRECYRLMGFPNSFKFIDKKTELYKQIGNSVAVPMVAAIAKEIRKQFF